MNNREEQLINMDLDIRKIIDSAGISDDDNSTDSVLYIRANSDLESVMVISIGDTSVMINSVIASMMENPDIADVILNASTFYLNETIGSLDENGINELTPEYIKEIKRQIDDEESE